MVHTFKEMDQNNINDEFIHRRDQNNITKD
jgi:hypothetical protein